MKVPANTTSSLRTYALTLRAGRATRTVRIKVAAAAASKREAEREHEVPALHAVQVAVGKYDTCAVLSDGHVYCWGENYYGTVGNGKTKEFSVLTEASEVIGIDEATQVSVNDNSACALLASGHVDCWGANFSGQLGNDTEGEPSGTPVAVDLEDAVSITTGDEFACSLVDGDHVDCWGNDDFGEMGNGENPKDKTDRFLSPVAASVKSATAVAAGPYSVCAVIEGGSVECWGYDYYDELGNDREGGEAEIEPTPGKASDVSGASQVGIGGGGSCVLASGRIECWGLGEQGQLGDGESISSGNTPVAATGITSADELAVGEDFVCARLQNATVQCWGDNYNGELGDGEHGTEKDRDTPVPVVGLSDVTQLSAGQYAACAVDAGRVYCWGDDENGQLGNGEYGPSKLEAAPTQVNGVP